MHLCTKFGCNWSEPVRTGAIWRRLTEITITIWPQMTFDLVMWPLTLSCDLQVRHNVKVPIVHLWSKFGYNWSEPVRTGAIWKRLTETLTDERTDGRTNGHTEFGSLCVPTNIRSGDTKMCHIQLGNSIGKCTVHYDRHHGSWIPPSQDSRRIKWHTIYKCKSELLMFTFRILPNVLFFQAKFYASTLILL